MIKFYKKRDLDQRTVTAPWFAANGSDTARPIGLPKKAALFSGIFILLLSLISFHAKAQLIQVNTTTSFVQADAAVWWYWGHTESQKKTVAQLNQTYSASIIQNANGGWVNISSSGSLTSMVSGDGYQFTLTGNQSSTNANHGGVGRFYTNIEFLALTPVKMQLISGLHAGGGANNVLDVTVFEKLADGSLTEVKRFRKNSDSVFNLDPGFVLLAGGKIYVLQMNVERVFPSIYTSYTSQSGSIIVKLLSATDITGISDDTGVSASDAVTNDGTLQLSGTALSGSTVTLKQNGSLIGSTTADASGKWTFFHSFTLSDRTYTFKAIAADAFGNEIGQSDDFIVRIDKSAPTITAPAALTVTTDAGKNTASGVVLGTPVTADNHQVASTINNAPATFPVGNTTVTWTVTDVAGNTATATQVVTVQDNEKPVPTIATLPALTGECSVTATAPTATDNVAGTITATTTDPLVYTAQGTYTITWTYTDGSGNTAAQTQQVIIKDITAPVFAAVAPITKINDVDKCGAVVTYTTPTATDNCSAGGKKVLLIWDEMTASTISLKNALTAAGLEVTLSTTAENGYDGTNPSLTGFDAVIHLNGTTYDVAMPVSGQNALVDFVLNQGKTYITNEWSAYEIDYTTAMRDIVVLERSSGFTEAVTYTTVADQAAHPILKDIPTSFVLPSAGGNVGGARTYSENQPKVLMTSEHGAAVAVREFANGGKAIGFQHAGNYDYSTVLSDANVQKLYVNSVKYSGGTDITITQTAGLASGALFPVGKTTNTFVATDAAGNTSEISFDVTVTDTQKPTVVTKNITVNLDANGAATITPADVINSATDNCAIAADGYSLSKTSFTCTDLGPKTVTLTVTDVHGNSQTATAVVTIADPINPTITAPVAVVVNTDAGKNTASGVALGTPTTADNCQDVTVTNNAPAAFPVGTTTVTWTVTDAADNEAHATQLVTVEDKEAPVPTIATLPTINGQCAATATVPTATDNVDGTVSATTSDPLSYTAQGTYTITWTYTDAAGNTSSQAQQVIVKDNTAPVVATRNITVQVDANGKATITPAMVDNSSADNCGIASMKLDQTEFACGGTATVTLTVTDVNGNSATGTAIVTVEDKVAPVANAKNITVELDEAGKVTIVASDVENGSTDNCGIASYELSKTAFDCSNVGPNTITLTVTDNSGNTHSTTAIVTVVDNIKPTITAPDDIIVDVDPGKNTASNVALGTPVTADNCSVANIKNYAPAEFATGTTIVIWEVTDVNGNTTKATQTVTVRRDVVAVATPATVTVPIRTTFANVPLPSTITVTYSDNSTEQIGVTWSQGNYNGTVAGNYSLTGQLDLASGTTNTTGLTAAITVVVEPNKVPTNLAFSATTFAPNIKADEAIGTLSTTDPDDTQFVYTLVSGSGDTDNSLFEVIGDKVYLKSNNGLSGRTSFSFRVRSTDPYQNTIEKAFTLTKSNYGVAADKLKIVNAFSPNGDGINDTWSIPELRFYNNVEVEVFDRSGVRLFHSTNPEMTWDGRSANGQVLQGAFFYIVQVKDINLVKKGVVTILKK
ncbi:HYR domain-containing protein [Pontibacter sp. Tf4]|uniref:HYR domain-containing protein n=1 Tax=Pontibacter sp. Tf4 TaxID=2761620 RepID=UPI001627B61E|nr:HYR domain-containing protein [Pontibacter sp. Tf4]MBB6611582.1 HYR domain-containing protein [Pontibacter sp. Tf4]